MFELMLLSIWTNFTSLGWVMGLTLIVGILQLVSSYITATKKLRDEPSYQLTKEGKFVVVILFCSAFFTVIVQFISNSDAQQDALRVAENTYKLLTNTDKAVNPFTPFNISIETSLPFGTVNIQNIKESLKIIHDSIAADENYKSWQNIHRYGFNDYNADSNGELLSIEIGGVEENRILKELEYHNNPINLYFYRGDTTRLAYDSLMRFSHLLSMTPNEATVSFDEIRINTTLKIDFENQKFIMKTRIPEVKIKELNGQKNDLQGLTDLIDKYLFISTLPLGNDMELEGITLETGKDFSRILFLGNGTKLKRVFTPLLKTPFYVHKFSKEELGYD